MYLKKIKQKINFSKFFEHLKFLLYVLHVIQLSKQPYIILISKFVMAPYV